MYSPIPPTPASTMRINTKNRLFTTPKSRLLLLLLLIPATLLFALKKDNHSILYREDFEAGSLLAISANKQVSTSYGIQMVDSPVYTGKKAARFELRESDPENNNGTRAELSFPGPRPDAGKADDFERWYSFALYFPAKDFEFDKSDEVISQWHQGGKATPSLCIRTKADRVKLRVKAGLDDKEWIDLGPVDKDVWQHYVLHVKHSSGEDGLVELWRNNVQLVIHRGANMYDLRSKYFHSPNWKLGIYKSAWNGYSTTQTHKRVIYFDDIKVGSGKASYADMR